MRDRLKTLVLDANGISWKAVVADTTLQGILGIRGIDRLPASIRDRPLTHRFLGSRFDRTSYIADWRDAICASSRLDVDVCNIRNLVEYWQAGRAIAAYDLIIVLHSALGDDASFLLRTAGWLNRRRGKLAVFIGNEYDLLDEKIRFLQLTDADYICTQLPLGAARRLYDDCPHARLLPMPHALNPRLYQPDPTADRVIDVGFIGDFYPLFIGDQERTEVISYFRDHAVNWGLSADIRGNRLPRHDWVRFLNHCRTIVGSESGTYYLDKRGRLISAAKKYAHEHPTATFREIFERFFRDSQCTFSGKAISSRHFESIGTKTCQVLLEGSYNDILKPGENYIVIRKGLTNIKEVVDRIKDESYRTKIANDTYEYVMSEHTYDHRVESLISAVLG